MATHHSKTGRAKGSNDKIVVPSWDNVWASFNAENEKTTIESMNADGWKTIQQAAKESGLSRARINHIANEGKLERIKRKIFVNGVTREVNFVRPKATTCQ
jgi:hypothetical protein